MLSYLLLRGRCSACHAPIGARYPLVELASGVLNVLAAWHFGPTWQAWRRWSMCGRCWR